MKNIILSSLAVIFLQSAMSAQSSDIDKKWRFGLRVTPQPMWLLSSDKNNVPAGTSLGTGFGLNLEYRFSNVGAVLFGIGGDFEGGKYDFKFDPANKYVVRYVRDADEFVSPENTSDTRMEFTLKSRTIKTTHVTLPVILKLSTAEYSGFKYFGMFGVELGIRVKSTATDKYLTVEKWNTASNQMELFATNTEEKDIDIASETSLLPMRLGLNAGIGTEYRLGGTTSAFLSVNFFRSFTNMMKKTADYAYFRTDNSGGSGTTYSFVKQNIKQSAVRVNIGIMF